MTYRVSGVPFRASEAHRLPKSGRYVSVASRQVKVKGAKKARCGKDILAQEATQSHKAGGRRKREAPIQISGGRAF
jgi:hypothetical protein